jgi:hypothetical protein
MVDMGRLRFRVQLFCKLKAFGATTNVGSSLQSRYRIVGIATDRNNSDSDSHADGKRCEPCTIEIKRYPHSNRPYS